MSATAIHRVPIELGERSYPIVIGTSLLDEPGTWSAVPASAQALIVTNTTVAPPYTAPGKCAGSPSLRRACARVA
jgi:3-dehydroquinate synthase